MIIPFEEEKAAQQLIELIHSFHSSTAFFQWFAGDDLKIQTVYEKALGTEYDRIGEYSVYGLRVFSGGGQFYLDKIQESFAKKLSKEKAEYYSSIPELGKLEKKKVNAVLAHPKYTVISQFFSSGQACGSSWEIYDIPNLLQVCKMKGLDLSSPSKNADA